MFGDGIFVCHSYILRVPWSPRDRNPQIYICNTHTWGGWGLNFSSLAGLEFKQTSLSELRDQIYYLWLSSAKIKECVPPQLAQGIGS